MKLDLECIKDILLTVEENTGYHRNMIISEKKMEYNLLKKYDRNKVMYHIMQSQKSNLIEAEQLDLAGNIVIKDLTLKGHKFIANIRENSKIDKIKQISIQMDGIQELCERTDNRISGRVFFTILQKFEEEIGLFMKKENILGLADEAHRNYYGINGTKKIESENMLAYKKYTTAECLHKTFPNVTYGFTGNSVQTPDRLTSNEFANIMNLNDMSQPILENTILPTMNEASMSRVEQNQQMRSIIQDSDKLELIIKDAIKGYVDNQMKAYNLIQQEDKTNKAVNNKQDELTEKDSELKTHSKNEEKKEHNTNVIETLMENIEFIRNIFQNFEYGHFATTTDSDRYEIIQAAANWILKTEQIKKEFMKYSYECKKAYDSCVEEVELKVKDEVLFFTSVRSFITKLNRNNSKLDVRDLNLHMAEMLEQAIQNDEILKILNMNDSNQITLLSDEEINKIAKMQKKNIAVEILMRDLKKYINKIGQQNVIRTEKFFIRLKNIVYLYNKRESAEDVEKIIYEIINLKNDMKRKFAEGNKKKRTLSLKL